MAADFSRGAGRFHSRRTRADDHDVGIADHALLLIRVAVDDIRVDRAAKRAGAGDAVIRAANVAGDAFPHQTFVAALNFLHPLRLGDQAAANGNQVGIAAGDNIFGDFRGTDVAGNHRGLVEFVAYRAREIALPAIFQRHLVNLEIEVVVLRGGDVDNIHFFLTQFEDLQGVFERISTFQKVIGANTQADRKTRAYAGPYLIDD